MFGGNRCGDFLLSFAHQRRGFVEDIGPVDRCNLSPGPEASFGRFERIVQVALLRMGQSSDLFFCRRVQDR